MLTKTSRAIRIVSVRFSENVRSIRKVDVDDDGFKVLLRLSYFPDDGVGLCPRLCLFPLRIFVTRGTLTRR